MNAVTPAQAIAVNLGAPALIVAWLHRRQALTIDWSGFATTEGPRG